MLGHKSLFLVGESHFDFHFFIAFNLTKMSSNPTKNCEGQIHIELKKMNNKFENLKNANLSLI